MISPQFERHYHRDHPWSVSFPLGRITRPVICWPTMTSRVARALLSFRRNGSVCHRCPRLIFCDPLAAGRNQNTHLTVQFVVWRWNTENNAIYSHKKTVTIKSMRQRSICLHVDLRNELPGNIWNMRTLAKLRSVHSASKGDQRKTAIDEWEFKTKYAVKMKYVKSLYCISTVGLHTVIARV